MKINSQKNKEFEVVGFNHQLILDFFEMRNRIVEEEIKKFPNKLQYATKNISRDKIESLFRRKDESDLFFTQIAKLFFLEKLKQITKAEFYWGKVKIPSSLEDSEFLRVNFHNFILLG